MARTPAPPPIGILRSFLLEEEGALPVSTGYLMVTMAASVPLGLALYSIYEGLCQAGWFASFVLGLF